MEKLDILDVSIHSTSTFGKTRWFEGTVTVEAGESFKKFSMDFPISDLAEMGVCTTLRSFKKVNEWANSDAGHAYINTNQKRESIMSRLLKEIALSASVPTE